MHSGGPSDEPCAACPEVQARARPTRAPVMRREHPFGPARVRLMSTLMRLITRSLTALALAALAMGLLAWAVQITAAALEERAAREGGGGRPAEERVFAAEVVAVTPATVRPTLSAFGEVRAARTLELRAPATGRIAALSPDWVEGGRVARGDVLVRMETAEAEAAVAVARADLLGARAEGRDARRTLDLARREVEGAEAQRDLQRQALDRQRDLVERGIGAAATTEAAELTLQSAEQTILTREGAVVTAEARVDATDLAVERARIALAEAERDLEDRTLRAAFDGLLGEAEAVEGGLVAVNERLGTLIDASRLEVAFRLSAAQHARLVDASGDLVGAPVRAVLDVLGLEADVEGRVSREAAVVGEGRTGRLVFATLDAAGADVFRPGDFVRVEVREPELRGVATLPATAVSPGGTVLVLGADDRLEEASVTVARRDGDSVLVLAGDLAGREVVAARTPALGAGVKVDPLRPETETSEAAETADAEADATIALDPDRRARLIAFVEGGPMPPDVKERLLARLSADRVPVAMVERIEGRMGG